MDSSTAEVYTVRAIVICDESCLYFLDSIFLMLVPSLGALARDGRYTFRNQWAGPLLTNPDSCDWVLQELVSRGQGCFDAHVSVDS